MIIKDPLQVAPTAYELLAVEQTIAPAEVHGAFARALAGRPREAKALNGARSLLQNPVERALLDALLYEPAAAESLVPSPADAEALAPSRRQETATAWTAALRARFPDLAALHSLAVLWYWWAMQASALPADGPPVEALWSKALAYWAALLQSETYWRGRLGLDAEQARQATATMESRLRETLYRLAEQARSAGDGRSEEVYQRLRTVFDSELETARNMVAAPLPLAGSGGQGFGCGRILLEEAGQLQEAHAWLTHALGMAPGDRHLERVRLGLSACSEAAQLVEARQWQPALAALARLGAADRQSAGARALEARALIGRGQQQASLGDSDEALASWAAALQASDDRELRQQAEGTIVETTLQKAQALAASQPEQAIAALEAGLQLVPEAGQLRDLLGQLLSDQAQSAAAGPIAEAERARQQPGGASDEDRQRWRQAWEPALRRAIAAQERARDLGYRPAGQRLAEARRRLDQLQASFSAAGGGRKAEKGEPPPLPPANTKDWQEWVADAGMARLENDYELAVACLRRALAVAPRDRQRQVMEMLANALANRAVHTINSLGDEVERFKRGSAPPEVAEHVREQAQKAKRDVDEAAHLNPADDHVRRQKEQVDELCALTQRGLKATPKPTPRPTPQPARAPGGQGKNAVDALLVLGGILLLWFTPHLAAGALSALLLYVGTLGCCLGMRRDLARPKSGCLISGLAATGILFAAVRLYTLHGWPGELALAVVAGWAFLAGAQDYNKAKGS